jgi:DNA polymerase
VTDHRNEVSIMNVNSRDSWLGRKFRTAARELASALLASVAELIVCLGAPAARAVIGPHHRLLEMRGRFFSHPWAARVTATVHPSAILRSADPERSVM